MEESKQLFQREISKGGNAAIKHAAGAVSTHVQKSCNKIKASRKLASYVRDSVTDSNWQTALNVTC